MCLLRDRQVVTAELLQTLDCGMNGPVFSSRRWQDTCPFSKTVARVTWIDQVSPYIQTTECQYLFVYLSTCLVTQQRSKQLQAEHNYTVTIQNKPPPQKKNLGREQRNVGTVLLKMSALNRKLIVLSEFNVHKFDP